MFAIGDKDWPGISKLTEECGELLQVCGKLMGTGGKEEHWDGSNLRERLQDEMADVLAAILFIGLHCPIDTAAVEKRAHAKLARFERWHELGETNSSALESVP